MLLRANCAVLCWLCADFVLFVLFCAVLCWLCAVCAVLLCCCADFLVRPTFGDCVSCNMRKALVYVSVRKPIYPLHTSTKRTYIDIQDLAGSHDCIVRESCEVVWSFRGFREKVLFLSQDTHLFSTSKSHSHRMSAESPTEFLRRNLSSKKRKTPNSRLFARRLTSFGPNPPLIWIFLRCTMSKS